MPRYVILTYSYSNLRNRRVDPALELSSRWFDQIDERSDGLTTYDWAGRLVRRGQRLMVCRVQASPGTESSDRNVTLDATLRGYGDASSWAGPRGVVGIAFDHGRRGVVELAPDRCLEANRGFLQTVYQIREGQLPRDRLGREYDDLLAIGATLRGARIAWVELLSCRVGAGIEGQELLDWLHVLWRVPVRALRGDLTVEEDAFGGAHAFVVPEGAGTTRRSAQPDGYYTIYNRTPPTAMRLWQFSAPIVPELRPGLVPPPPPEP